MLLSLWGFFSGTHIGTILRASIHYIDEYILLHYFGPTRSLRGGLIIFVVTPVIVINF